MKVQASKTTNQVLPPSISVIIPVYNTEKYLSESIESVLAQLKDISFEILLINDETPDGSQEIIDSYCIHFPFIHGYLQEHGRQGRARNTGLKHAKGEYIVFLDSDDTLTKGTLGHFHDIAEKHSSDIVIGVARSFKGWRRWIGENHRNYVREIVNTNLEQTPVLLSDTSSCNKIYRRSFLLENNIWFPEKTFCEDVEFIYKSYLLSEQISISPRIFHEYRGRKRGEAHSGTQTFSEKRVCQCSAVFRKSLEHYLQAVNNHIFERLCAKVVTVTCQQFRRFAQFPSSNSSLYSEIQATLRLCPVKQIADNAEHYTIPLLMIREGYFPHASAILNYGAITPVIEDFFDKLGKENPESLANLLKVNVFNKISILDRIISHGSKKNLVFVIKRIFRRIHEDLLLLKKDISQLLVFIVKLFLGKHKIFHNPRLLKKIQTILGGRTTGVLWKFGFVVLRPFILRSSTQRSWLISEREGKGIAESGYSFFKYCSEVLQLKHLYYILDKRTPIPKDIQYPELIITKGSIRHFITLTRAECFIFTNNELDVSYFLPGKLKKNPVKTVFLNHGVTYYNPGVYLRNIAHRFDMIIAVSEQEKQQKIDDWSLQDSSKVKVTGFPIFDPLHTFSPKQEILFCPTWRNQLDDLSEDEFQNSRYFKEIASFLCDNHFHDFLEQHSLQLTFRCHFRMANLLHVFQTNLPSSIQVELHDNKRSLQNCLRDAKLLITDYSSILWDMAFMQKPMILFQFDRHNFLAERGLHNFSIPDSTIKFASFAVNREELLTHLSSIAMNNFKISQEQQDNISKFFAFMDNNNSERVYKEVDRLFQ